MKHVAYYLASGEITKYMRLLDQNIELNLGPGESYKVLTLPIIDVGRVYIVDDTVTYRPVMDLIVSSAEITTADELIISGIPVGATVTYPDGSDVVDDGVIEWECAEPGVFFFTIELFPYLTERLEIEVTEA